MEAEDVESDLEDLEEHYYSNLRQYSAILEQERPQHYTTQQLNAQEWDFDGGRDGLDRFLSLPATWPLARLMFPIRDLRKQRETLLQTYCFEIAVTCADACEQNAYVRRMALHLGQYLASNLAETITGLLQKVLTHPAQGLVDETNAALLTQKFWVQAVYTELLCASSRIRAVREKEQQRPPNGLVKVVCLPFDRAAAQKHGRAKAIDARFETMIGSSSWVDSLFVWFPAAWMPLVIDALREKSYLYNQRNGQLGAVAFTDHTHFELPDSQEFPTQSSGGRRTKVVAVLSCNRASMLIGSLLTRKCLFLSSPDCMKEFCMMSSYRRQRWPGTLPRVIEFVSVFCYQAPWKQPSGCLKSEPVETCGLCK